MSTPDRRSVRALLLAFAVALGSGITGIAQDPIAKGGRVPRPSEVRAQVLQPAAPSTTHRWGKPSEELYIPGSNSSLPDVYGECTRIAFQSWVGNNWEILVARGDGSELTRLTENAAGDQAPSLNPGCQLMAFATDRNGNDDIYTMRGDGSNVRRITTDPARDVLPTLSPDGSRIAFQSYRDGERPEIYVADTAGGSPVRLTYDDAYDGQPDWSPDGGKIAFISGRSGSNNIWVMDADGANPRQITTLPYSGGPKWSPDGKRFAFASDDLNTGYSSLWVVDVEGTDPRLVWRPTTSQTDTWPGGWSFDGMYILYEEATWVSDGVSSAYLDIINPQDPLERHRLVGSGINMAASWALCDSGAPASKVNPLAATSTSPALVSWAGTDDCSTHIEYQLQYRVGGTASWMDWPVTPGSSWTVATQSHFPWDEPGRVVYFRSRARDAIGRVEAWPSGPGDAYTSFPARIRGFVGDCRGVPLADAELSGPAPVSHTSHPDINGRYLLLASGETEPTLTVSAKGYQSLELGRPGLDHMTNVDHYLSGEPELVQNGGFEASHAAWYATSGATFMTGNYAYGNGFARLSNALPFTSILWTVAENVVAIRQTVHIPSSTHEPTLSFMYVLGEGNREPVGRLQAIVSDDGGESTVVQTDQATPWITINEDLRCPLWQHAYADMTPWAGRTVSLILQYAPGWTNSRALLDQISIASWPTPRVMAVNPRQVAPGRPVLLTVRGANFRRESSAGTLTQGLTSSTAPQVSLGAYQLPTTYVSSTMLRATAPPTIPLGLYDVWVQNPAGHRSGLANGFGVGGYLAIPLIQRSAGSY